MQIKQNRTFFHVKSYLPGIIIVWRALFLFCVFAFDMNLSCVAFD